MKGDFTRFTFDPTKHYTQVLKQQGRVDLDADWNEQAAIEDSLERTARMDLAGVECGAPSLKPGFAITLAAGGTDLHISAGRFYAHGLICELFDTTTYLTQPFLPNPPALAPVHGRTDLVYLDVWERHITAVEDPTIREVALGGPDTTTRVKTIFPIRITQGVGNVDCSNAPLPQPSGGQLTTSIVPVPPEDDLCLIGPAGGFKGLENRLYRVEVHNPGALGTATFKWSRDNGSVVFPIQEFVTGQPNKIRVSRLGRDQVLGLHEGDFVEVLDDNNELADTPGTMAQITLIDAANRELTLSVPVPGSMSAHPKVRRWDQKSATIVTAAGPIPLEDGIQVAFSGANFQTGDYWMFAARATDGTIEILNNAPPQGITHTYCRLALVTWNVPLEGPVTATIHDCRPIFPSAGKDCCCCTVTVGDGSKSQGGFTDIQQAINSLPKTDAFATVCILPGNYVLTTPVTITRSNLLIHGCGANTSIQAPASAPAFLVDSAKKVSFASLLVVSQDNILSLAIVARNASELTIADSVFDASKGRFSIAVQADTFTFSDNTCTGGLWIMDGSRRVKVFNNRIENSNSAGIALGGTERRFEIPSRGKGIAELEIRNNRIFANADSGICTIFEDFPNNPEFGEIKGIAVVGNALERNVQSLTDIQSKRIASGGIVLQHVRDLRIFENRIVRNGGGRRAACGVFLRQCANIDIEDNAILDNGNAQGVVQRHCVEFRTMRPDGDNPRQETDVRFTLMDSNRVALSSSQSLKMGGVIGLLGSVRVEIDLPSADSIELSVFVPENNRIDLTASRREVQGEVQVDSTSVNGGQAEQRVLLSGPGITKVTISALDRDFLILEFCRINTPSVFEFQGGILAHLTTTDPVPFNGAFFPAGYPAIRVHNNVVNTPAGHALLITAIGSVSVEGNSLTCNGARRQPGLEAVRPVAIAIYNFGLTYALQQSVYKGGFLGRLILLAGGDPAGFAQNAFLYDGRVLFQGNQVAFRAINGTVASGAWACGIFSLDTCQIANNQFRAEAPGVVLGTDLFSMGDMVSTSGNALAEFPNLALFSSVSTGRNVITSLNQAMHCLFSAGSEQQLQQDNQITINTRCEALTPQVMTFLTRR